MNNKISDKDKKDWEDFLLRNEELPNKDIDKIKQNNLKTLNIDLHGYSLEEANKIIKDFIVNSHNEGYRKLTVITGKGLHSKNDLDPFSSREFGILKYSVPEFIRNSQELMEIIYEIKQASIEDGGSGSFYIYLKKKK